MRLKVLQINNQHRKINMPLLEITDLPETNIPFVHCGSNTEMVRDIEQRCGKNVFLGKCLSPESSLKENLLNGGVFPERYFDDFKSETRTIKMVCPEKVGILEGETFQQFCIRMRAQCDLYPLPANSLHALCLNFDPGLYQKPCVITKINSTMFAGFKISSAFIIHMNHVTLSPEIAWAQFYVHKKLNTDYNYLFLAI